MVTDNGNICYVTNRTIYILLKSRTYLCNIFALCAFVSKQAQVCSYTFICKIILSCTGRFLKWKSQSTNMQHVSEIENMQQLHAEIRPQESQ